MNPFLMLTSLFVLITGVMIVVGGVIVGVGVLVGVMRRQWELESKEG